MNKKAQKAQRINEARAAIVSGYDLIGDKQISPKDVVFINREKHKETANFWAYKMQVAGVSETVFYPKKSPKNKLGKENPKPLKGEFEPKLEPSNDVFCIITVSTTNDAKIKFR